MTTENTVLLEEMLREAERADEPGELNKDRVVNKGDADMPPMVATKLQSAGYVYIYDTITGERSTTNRNMLPAQLKKMRLNGSPFFTTRKPNFEPKRGTLKCMLHPDNPNREHYNDLGLPVCMKSNLISQYQVKRHTQKRHPSEWAAIEDERKEIERQDTLASQRAIRDAMVRGNSTIPPLEAMPTSLSEATDDIVGDIGTEEAPLYVSENPKLPKRKAKRKK